MLAIPQYIILETMNDWIVLKLIQNRWGSALASFAIKKESNSVSSKHRSRWSPVVDRLYTLARYIEGYLLQRSVPLGTPPSVDFACTTASVVWGSCISCGQVAEGVSLCNCWDELSKRACRYASRLWRVGHWGKRTTCIKSVHASRWDLARAEHIIGLKGCCCRISLFLVRQSELAIFDLSEGTSWP